MLGFVLFVAGASAFNCSEYGLEAFDRVNVATSLLSTPPLTTNRTIYFNLCSPLEEVSECGHGNRFCAIDRADINGEWVTTAVRPISGAEPREIIIENTVGEDDILMVSYGATTWGDYYAFAVVDFACSNETSIHVGRASDDDDDRVAIRPNYFLAAEVTIKTPQVCGFRYTRPPSESGSRLWTLLSYASLFTVIAVTGYVSLSILITSKARPLGPLTGEVYAALRELPVLVRETSLNLYERVTGRGTGRNRL